MLGVTLGHRRLATASAASRRRSLPSWQRHLHEFLAGRLHLGYTSVSRDCVPSVSLRLHLGHT